MRSLIDALLITLELLPSNENYEEIKSNLENISLSVLSKIMIKSGNRYDLIEKLNLDRNIKELIWSELPESKNSDDILQYGNVDDKMELYDRAIRKLEWKMLKIGTIYNRDEIITSMKKNRKKDIAKKILEKDTTLIDIISFSVNQDFELLIYSIGKCLVYKAKHDSNIKHTEYKLFRKWLKLDPIHSVVILADSINSDGYYNSVKLLERFQNRIRSNKYLNKIISE